MAATGEELVTLKQIKNNVIPPLVVRSKQTLSLEGSQGSTTTTQSITFHVNGLYGSMYSGYQPRTYLLDDDNFSLILCPYMLETADILNNESIVIYPHNMITAVQDTENHTTDVGISICISHSITHSFELYLMCEAVIPIKGYQRIQN